MSPKAIRERLSEIGRYQDGISPKLSKWQELEDEKLRLRKLLKESGDRTSGVNPKTSVKSKNPDKSKSNFKKSFYQP